MWLGESTAGCDAFAVTASAGLVGWVGFRKPNNQSILGIKQHKWVRFQPSPNAS